jgi:purine catabolism regulator
MERGVRIQGMLSKLAAEGEGLVEIIRAMSDLSGRGIVLQDKRLTVLAEQPSPSLVSIWEDILEQITSVESLPGGFADRKKAGKSTIILQQEISNELGRIVTPVTVGGVARGYLSFIDIHDNMDSLDSLIAEQGALVCAIEMSRLKAVREAEKRLKGDLLTALLQESITPRDANLWVQSMGFDLEKRHVAMRFSWDAQSPPSMRRLETLVNGEVTKGGVKALVEALGSEIVCVCQVDSNTGRPVIPLTLANAVTNQAQQEFPEIPVRCGIGNPAEDLSLWRDSFRQAGQALEMARRLDERNPQYFPDLSVYRLLLQLEHHPDLQTFKNEILGNLICYEGGGDFINTLEAYFEHNGVLSQAAEALYVHRNTLIYRMERIAEISGLDLDNTETRLAVQLALRIHRMTPKG